MQYFKAARTGEIKDGQKKKVSVENKVILLTNIQDKYYAIDNKCPHRGGSLYDGRLEGNNIICPRHGSVFDVRTGEAVKGAKIALINIKVGDTTAYPVKIEDDDILIGME
jgi:3-phenylpropionate/trans-cinnamate dioxygenase ferredoxin subunit